MCTDFSTFNNSSELQEQIELLVEYLEQNYEFRHNVFSDVYEFRELSDKPKPFRTFTREARNSVVLHIKRDGLEVPNLGQNVDEIIFSEETQQYDPVKDWLQSLPAWDGQDHVGKLFSRIPGITTEQHHMLAIWFRSAVAHWLGLNLRLGRVLKAHNFERKRITSGSVYYIVPKRLAA